MIRWERLGALIVPVVVIAALACGVRGAAMFGERWGWLAGFAALMFVALVMDRGESDGQASTQDLATQQTQPMRAVR